MKAIIIVGKKDFMTKKSFDMVSKKKSKLEEIVRPVVKAEVLGSTRINCLAVIVATMKKIQENNADGELFVIYTLDQFISWIDTAKYWIRDGKKSDGTDVLAAEVELWKEFYTLYKEMFEDVIFKDSSKLRLPKNPKFAISEDQRAFSKELDEIWKLVNEKATTDFSEEEEMAY